MVYGSANRHHVSRYPYSTVSRSISTRSKQHPRCGKCRVVAYAENLNLRKSSKLVQFRLWSSINPVGMKVVNANGGIFQPKCTKASTSISDVEDDEDVDSHSVSGYPCSVCSNRILYA
jgi:hypothetical protein